MGHPGPVKELGVLRRAHKALRKKFLEPHLNNQALAPITEAEKLDAAAFGVLLHGYLENYFEGLAYWRLDLAVDDWKPSRPIRRATTTMVFLASAPKFEEPWPTVFDAVRKALDERKASHTKEIKTNHGIGVVHLRNLLFPLGVDVPASPEWTGSLDQLIKLRHHWAHQFRYGAEVVKPASEVALIAEDCLKFAEELGRRTSKR